MAAPEPLLQWSSQFVVSPATGSASLPGDKISLPPSALEGLLEASTKLAAERAQRDLPTFDLYNSATFSAYRRTESEFQDQRQQLPYPLTFRLVNPANGRVVYAGIREFSAEDGHVLLSEFLQDALGLVNKVEDNHETSSETIVSPKAVTVHVQELPKGTFVKLRPLEAGYDPDDWKALLEQHLRQNYTTMTKGEILIVPGPRTVGGKREEYRFLVDGFKPENDGVCIVDTDLEVDIEALNEEQARETLARIAAKLTRKPGSEQGSSIGGELDIVRPQNGRVVPGEYVDYELMSWDRSQALEVEISCEDDSDLNLLVNPFSATLRTKPRLDEHVFAVFDNRPTKRIRLDPTNAFLKDAEALHVSLYAFEASNHGRPADRAAANFTIRAGHPNPAIEKSGSDSQGKPPNEGEVRCTNCGQWVPQRTLMLHQNFCLRNNVLCPKGCGQVFQKRSAEYEQHWHCPYDEEFGATETARSKHNHIHHPAEILRCPDCNTAETFANLPSLALHRTTTCPAKLILCRFCHLEVPQEGDPDIPNAEALLSGLTPHELADGARTTECHLCSRIVKLRDMETHLKNHDLERLSRPMPRVCRNVNCGRTLDVCSPSGDTRAGTRMGQGPGNDIDLCSVCFGPLYVSMYDPENKALRRRIERRYLQQLLTGCNKAWCRNEFCKAGRAHLGITGDITTKDALPMVKPFLDGAVVASARTPLHFCVDEASQNRRSLAVMLAAQTNGTISHGGYAFEWCVGALEATNGNLDEAQQWLKNWAPSKTDAGQ